MTKKINKPNTKPHVPNENDPLEGIAREKHHDYLKFFNAFTILRTKFFTQIEKEENNLIRRLHEIKIMKDDANEKYDLVKMEALTNVNENMFNWNPKKNCEPDA